MLNKIDQKTPSEASFLDSKLSSKFKSRLSNSHDVKTPTQAINFTRMVRRVNIMWQELKIPAEDRKYYMSSLLKEKKDPTVENCDEIVKYIVSLNRHRICTINVLRAINKREEELRTCISLLHEIHENGSIRLSESIQLPESNSITWIEIVIRSLKRLQASTLIVVRFLQLWRKSLWRPNPFIWNGKNYLFKIQRDMKVIQMDDFIKQFLESQLYATKKDLILLLYGDENDLDVEELGSEWDELIAASLVVQEEQMLQEALRSERRVLSEKGVFIPTLRLDAPVSRSDPSWSLENLDLVLERLPTFAGYDRRNSPDVAESGCEVGPATVDCEDSKQRVQEANESFLKTITDTALRVVKFVIRSAVDTILTSSVPLSELLVEQTTLESQEEKSREIPKVATEEEELLRVAAEEKVRTDMLEAARLDAIEKKENLARQAEEHARKAAVAINKSIAIEKARLAVEEKLRHEAAEQERQAAEEKVRTDAEERRLRATEEKLRQDLADRKRVSQEKEERRLQEEKEKARLEGQERRRQREEREKARLLEEELQGAAEANAQRLAIATAQKEEEEKLKVSEEKNARATEKAKKDQEEFEANRSKVIEQERILKARELEAETLKGRTRVPLLREMTDRIASETASMAIDTAVLSIVDRTVATSNVARRSSRQSVHFSEEVLENTSASSAGCKDIEILHHHSDTIIAQVQASPSPSPLAKAESFDDLYDVDLDSI